MFQYLDTNCNCENVSLFQYCIWDTRGGWVWLWLKPTLFLTPYNNQAYESNGLFNGLAQKPTRVWLGCNYFGVRNFSCHCSNSIPRTFFVPSSQSLIIDSVSNSRGFCKAITFDNIVCNIGINLNFACRKLFTMPRR